MWNIKELQVVEDQGGVWLFLGFVITFVFRLNSKLFASRSQSVVWDSWDPFKEVHEVKDHTSVKGPLKMEDRPVAFNVIVYEKFTNMVSDPRCN